MAQWYVGTVEQQTPDRTGAEGAEPAHARPETLALDAQDYDAEAVEELRASWLRRCEAAGCAEGPDDSDQRLGLLIALERAAAPDALAQVRGLLKGPDRLPSPVRLRSPGTLGARRAALDRAAAEWGAAVGSPAVVVDQLVQLRYLVTGSSVGDRLGRLVDRTMSTATRSATDELQRAAFSDPLTGCSNRRGLERDLDRELARCARAELDLSVVALDVDGLKKINDSEGHAAGDRALLLLVETLRRALRGLDGVYRVGGDEFIVLLPDASADDAVTAMARVEALGPPRFTWGVAGVRATGLFDAPALLAAADAQLYERRRSSRQASSRANLRRLQPKLRGPGEKDAQAGATG